MKAKAKRGVSKQNAFLAAFAATASITRAATACRIQRQLHYRWLTEDPAYEPLFATAREHAADSLEAEAVRRAFEGIRKPVFWKGKLVRAKVLEYSDALLMFLLKGMRPDKFRETWKGEISGPAGAPIVLENKHLAFLDDTDLSTLIGFARKAAAAAGDGSGAETPPA